MSNHEWIFLAVWLGSGSAAVVAGLTALRMVRRRLHLPPSGMSMAQPAE